MNARQNASLKRFEKRLPTNAGSTRIYSLPNGGPAFQADVPATNISGSYATYEKQIDSGGQTIYYVKTTYAPDGTIVHVKEKFPYPQTIYSL